MEIAGECKEEEWFRTVLAVGESIIKVSTTSMNECCHFINIFFHSIFHTINPQMF